MNPGIDETATEPITVMLRWSARLKKQDSYWDIPMRLLRISEAFDNPDWIFEPKMDGFRAVAHIEGHRAATT